MIGLIKGTIRALYLPSVIVETVQGIGYEVEMPLSTACQLQVDEVVALWTHLVVREDAHLLYGFATPEDKQLFRTLIKINGVGPKMALTMLSALTRQQLVHAVMQQDIAMLVKVPGIGKKTAERLMIELKDKLQSIAAGEIPTDGTATPVTGGGAVGGLVSAEEEAILALTGLGYKPAEAERAIAAFKGQQLDVAALIRQALKGMMK